MSHRTAIVWALALTLAAGGTAQAIDLLAPGLPLPSPTDVVKVLDALTRKDSDTKVDLKVGDAVSQGRLLVARSRVDVSIQRSSRNWRGRVNVLMTVPSEATYSVDLSEIKPQHVRIDPARRTLTVTMPEPRVEAVTPVLSDVKTEQKFQSARFRRFDRNVARELQNAILTADYQTKARTAAEAQLPDVRKVGRLPLQQLLERLLQPTCPGLRVVVE
jgi:hypothetical protein